MSSRRDFLPLASNPVPLTWDAIVFRESLLLEYPKGAIGYRLLCLRLAVWLPLQGRSKRYRGSWSRTPYFTISPHFEVPRVPEAGRYKIVYIMPGGVEVVPDEDELDINFFQDMKDSPLIRAAKRSRRPPGRSPTGWMHEDEDIDEGEADPEPPPVAVQPPEAGDEDDPEDRSSA